MDAGTVFFIKVYFDDGKIVRYDAMPFLEDGIFRKLKDLQIFMNSCTILNGTCVWDIAGKRISINTNIIGGIHFSRKARKAWKTERSGKTLTLT